MQASAVMSMSPNLNFHGFSKDYTEISPEMIQEFNEKLRFGGSESEFAEKSKDFEEKEAREEEEEEENEEEEEEEEEFSFFGMNTEESPISAEDIFQDGQIRPTFPIFDQSLLFADYGDFSRSTSVSSSASASASSLRPPLKKLFFEDRRDAPSSASDDELDGAAPGTYCEWHGKSAVEASPEMSKKCNSTGFSRLWRFRDLVVRSSSDGKDAFVFLNPSGTKPAAEKLEKEKKVSPASGPVAAAEDSPAAKVTAAKKKKKSESVSSAHERHYVRNRAKKEVDKRRSYLPYRPGLVGFFANVNGLSRNVHPF